MARFIPVLACAGIVGLSALAPATQGALLVYEGFDYTAGDNLTNQSGGIGFSNKWSASNYTIAGASLDNGAFPDTMLEGLSASPTTGGTTRNGVRSLDVNSTLDMDGEGNTYYVSFLVMKTSTSASGGEGAYFYLRQGTTNTLRFGLTNDEKTTPDTGTTVEANGVYFFVAKIVTSQNGDDQIYTNVYTNQAPDASEPAGWLSSTSAALTGTIANMKIEHLSNTLGGFDEIRIGTTYQDVVVVPEPATFGFLGGSLLLLTRVRRSR